MITDERDAQWRAEYEAGASLQKIANKHNVAPSTARHGIVKAGGIMRKRGRPLGTTGTIHRDSRAPEVMYEITVGGSAREIASRAGVSRAYVYQVRAKYMPDAQL